MFVCVGGQHIAAAPVARSIRCRWYLSTYCRAWATSYTADSCDRRAGSGLAAGPWEMILAFGRHWSIPLPGSLRERAVGEMLRRSHVYFRGSGCSVMHVDWDDKSQKPVNWNRYSLYQICYITQVICLRILESRNDNDSVSCILILVFLALHTWSTDTSLTFDLTRFAVNAADFTYYLASWWNKSLHERRPTHCTQHAVDSLSHRGGPW